MAYVAFGAYGVRYTFGAYVIRHTTYAIRRIQRI
jgi:hypothetical protein